MFTANSIFFIRIGLINIQKFENVCLCIQHQLCSDSIACAMFNREKSIPIEPPTWMRWNGINFTNLRRNVELFLVIKIFIYFIWIFMATFDSASSKWISDSISFRRNRTAQGHVTSWCPIRKRYLCSFNVFNETIKPSFLLMALNVWSN